MWSQRQLGLDSSTAVSWLGAFRPVHPLNLLAPPYNGSHNASSEYGFGDPEKWEALSLRETHTGYLGCVCSS